VSASWIDLSRPYGRRWTGPWTTGRHPGTTAHNLWTVLWAVCGPPEASEIVRENPCGASGSRTRTVPVTDDGDRPGATRESTREPGNRSPGRGFPAVVTGSDLWTAERSAADRTESTPGFRGAGQPAQGEPGVGVSPACPAETSVGRVRRPGAFMATVLSDQPASNEGAARQERRRAIAGGSGHATVPRVPSPERSGNGRGAVPAPRSAPTGQPDGSRTSAWRSPSISCMEGLSSCSGAFLVSGHLVGDPGGRPRDPGPASSGAHRLLITPESSHFAPLDAERCAGGATRPAVRGLPGFSQEAASRHPAAGARIGS